MIAIRRNLSGCTVILRVNSDILDGVMSVEITEEIKCAFSEGTDVPSFKMQDLHVQACVECILSDACDRGRYGDRRKIAA